MIEPGGRWGIYIEYNKDRKRWEVNAYDDYKPVTVASMTLKELKERFETDFRTVFGLCEIKESDLAKQMLADEVYRILIDQPAHPNGKPTRYLSLHN